MFLLLTQDNGRSVAQFRRMALIAAALADLRAAGRVDISSTLGSRVDVLDPEPTGDAPIDAVLAELSRKESGPRLQSALSARRFDPTEAIAVDLAAAGIVARKDGMFGPTWPVRDPRVEDALRQHLAAVLRAEREPLAHDLTELGILHAMRAVPKVLRVDVPDIGRGPLGARVKSLVPKDPLTTGLRRAFDAMNVAIAPG